jgi:hypothetical protein
MGRVLMVIGAVILLAGLAFTLGDRLGLGRLPGDVTYRRGNFSFYFPIATSIILSLLLTLIFNLWRR